MKNNDNNHNKKRKLKKIITISAIIVAAVVIIYIAFILIYDMLKEPVNTIGINSGDISFYEADYNEDIFQKELFFKKNRDIYYLEYGSGEQLNEENLDDFSSSAKLFHKYFSIVTNGDYEGYRSLFTKMFFENYKISERFTMQKIYDIEVNLYERKIVNENGTDIKVELYIVKYKIMENNGTFRSDIGSNMIKPLVFELCTIGDSVLINGIDFKQYVND